MSFNTFIELHLIQSISPANLNRDDTGSPKDCEFGGHRRARISSQARKRPIRESPRFTKMTGVDNGTRSKWMTRPIVKALVEQHGKDSADATGAAKVFVKNYAAGLDREKPEKTNVLVFFSPSEVERIASLLVENWQLFVNLSVEDERIEEAKAAAKKAGKKSKKQTNPFAKETKSLISKFAKTMEKRTSAPDIALFGRMLASKPELNIDAACQVAHAISTHRVTMEMDYYTAVDELLTDEEAGAGMVGFTGFNSACFYWYSRIDWNQLVKNLDGDHDLAERTVKAYLRTAISALPTGKQNAFAAQNPTNFALAVVRNDGMSWNLANAFETPVKAKKGEGYIANSVQKLDQLWGELNRFYDDAEIVAHAAFVTGDYPLNTLTEAQKQESAEPHTVSTWLTTVTDALTEA